MGEIPVHKMYTRYESMQWPPRNLLLFIQWFQARWEDIPPEQRLLVEVELGCQQEYDMLYPTVEISYTRPETPEEIEERETKEREKTATFAREKDAQERALFAILKKKHGLLGSISEEEPGQFKVAVTDWIPIGDPIRTRLLKVLDDMRARAL